MKNQDKYHTSGSSLRIVRHLQDNTVNGGGDFEKREIPNFKVLQTGL